MVNNYNRNYLPEDNYSPSPFALGEITRIRSRVTYWQINIIKSEE